MVWNRFSIAFSSELFGNLDFLSIVRPRGMSGGSPFCRILLVLGTTALLSKARYIVSIIIYYLLPSNLYTVLLIHYNSATVTYTHHNVCIERLSLLPFIVTLRPFDFFNQGEKWILFVSLEESTSSLILHLTLLSSSSVSLEAIYCKYFLSPSFWMDALA